MKSLAMKTQWIKVFGFVFYEQSVYTAYTLQTCIVTSQYLRIYYGVVLQFTEVLVKCVTGFSTVTQWNVDTRYQIGSRLIGQAVDDVILPCIRITIVAVEKQ